MRKVTLRGLAAHKLRLALTSLAIVLSVTFIAGTFVLTDTLDNTFYALVGSTYQKVDFQVRGVAQFPNSDAWEAVHNPLPEPLLTSVRHVPGSGRQTAR
jgi:putative ABC transport system permease protein